MNPNDVKELIDTLIDELQLPILAHDSGPQLVSDNSPREKRDAMDKVISQWMNGCGKSHSISVGRTAAKIDEAITCLALETHRTPDIEGVLKDLIVERSLPLKVVNRGYGLNVIPDEGTHYQSEDMETLKTLIDKEGVDVEIRHSGFGLHTKENGATLQYTQVEALANSLESSLKDHGLHVQLLHNGFVVEKDQDVEVDIAEIEEITLRLEIMVGIRYVQGGYTYQNDVPNKQLHWHSAQVNTALPLL